MKKILNKKYFLKTVLLIFITFMIIINLLSISLYKVHENFMVEKIKAIRLENLKEVNNMSEHLNNSVILLSNNILNNSTIKKLFHEETLTNFEKLEALRKISSLQSMSMNIHSIWLYNDSENKVYSSLDEDTDYIIDLINDNLHSVKIGSIEQDIIKIGNRLTHSYSFTTGDINNPKDKLIINLDLAWLNQISSKQDTKLYLIDNRNKFVYSIQKSTQLLETNDLEILKNESSNKNNIKNIDKIFILDDKFYEENEIVTYSGLKGTDWSLMNMSSSNDIIDYKNLTKRFTFNVNMLFLFLTLLLSLFLSKKITTPFSVISKLLHNFNGRDPKEDPFYLSNSIENIIDEIKDLENRSKIYSEKLSDELLKEALLGNIKGKEINRILKDFDFDVDSINDFSIIYCHKAAKLLRNLEINNDYIMSSLAIGDNMIYILNDIPMQERSRLIDRFIFLGVKYVVISKKNKGIENFHKEYSAILECSKNRIFNAKDNIIYSEDNKRDKLNYPIDLEGEIISSLRSKALDDNIEKLDGFLEKLSTCNYNSFELHIMRLFFTIRDLVDEISPGNTVTELFNTENFKTYFQEAETIDELKTYFINIFIEVKDIIYSNKSTRNIKIVKKAMKLVKEKYHDSSLSVQDISESLNLSSSYLNQLSKEEFNLSISQYITQERLQRSKDLLLNGDKTIKQIAYEVGFNNDNYFYSVFRKEVGVTPGEYRKSNRKYFKT